MPDGSVRLMGLRKSMYVLTTFVYTLLLELHVNCQIFITHAHTRKF